MLHFSFALERTPPLYHHLFRSAKERTTDPLSSSSSWVNGETSRWVRAVRQPRRTRERRTTSVESAAVGFIQFIIYKSAISDDIIFLSLFLSSATTKRMNRHRSLVRRRYVVVREGVFVGFIETEKRSLVVFTTVLGARTLTEALLKARSIRFGFGQIRSKIVALRKREKTARFCLEGARKRDERSVGTVSIFRGKVVSIIPLRVIFVVLVECPFGISDLSLDLMNERERERSKSIARGARRRTKRDLLGREDKGF